MAMVVVNERQLNAIYAYAVEHQDELGEGACLGLNQQGRGPLALSISTAKPGGGWENARFLGYIDTEGKVHN